MRMGSSGWRVGVMAVLLLLRGGSLDAQAGIGTVAGRVVDDSARPVAFAEILIPALGRFGAPSDTSGTFRLDSVPTGRRRFVLRRAGLRSLEVDLDVAEGINDLGRLTLSPILAVRRRQPEERPAFSLWQRTEAFRQGQRVNVWYLPNGGRLSSDGLAFALGVSRTERAFLAFGRPDETLSGFYGGFVGGMRWCPPFSNPLATRLEEAASGEVASVEVLESNGTVWAQAWPGRRGISDCLRSAHLEVGAFAFAAAPTPRGWGVIVPEGKHLALQFFHTSGRPAGWVALWATLSLYPGDSVRMAPTPRGVTIASGRWPFGWAEVDTAGTITIVSDPFARGSETPDIQRFAGWRGYAVLPIEHGFVQTLEKPDLGDRAHLVYDGGGRLVSASIGNLPVLIASHSGGARRLLGAWSLHPSGKSMELRLYTY